MTRSENYHLKGRLLGAWGCACSFEEPPSFGTCEGVYLWQVDSGHYDGVELDGLVISEVSEFPEAIHLGNGTSVYLVDERATEDQRQAIESMVRKEAPFSVFIDLTTQFMGFRSVRFQAMIDGINSHATIPGKLDMHLAPMKNPVTGEDELATLNKSTGFTSQTQELCTTSAFKFDREDLSVDFPGKYAEFCPFEYSK